MKLKINNKKFDFFNELTVTLTYASAGSTFSFSGFFAPENRDRKGLFRPFTYQKVEVLDDFDKRLITGRILNHGFVDSRLKALTAISGYSLPGVLQDCPIPLELYPLQSDGKTLKEITEALIKPFGLNLVISPAVAAEANEPYPQTEATEKQSIFSYIDELASQKNIVISHTSAGSLLFTRSRTDANPIAEFIEGIPGVKMSLSCDGQSMHSKITVQKQPDAENDNAGEETVNNPFVSIFRPTVKSQTSGDDIDTAQAVKNALSNELKSIVLTIETDRWTWNDDGKVTMTPNNIITVHNHHLHLYNFTKFFVQSITFIRNSKEQKAILTCVIPEVYNSETPRNIFIIPPLHE